MSRSTSKLVENLRTLHLQSGAHGLLGALEISPHENYQQNGNSSTNKAREISNNVAALPIDLVGEVSKDISKYKVVSNKCKVFVGNIGFKVRARELKDFFGYFGDVVYAQIIMDRVKKRSKGVHNLLPQPILPRPPIRSHDRNFNRQWYFISRNAATKHLKLLTRECNRKIAASSQELLHHRTLLERSCTNNAYIFYCRKLDSMALSLKSLLENRRNNKYSRRNLPNPDNDNTSTITPQAAPNTNPPPVATPAPQRRRRRRRRRRKNNSVVTLDSTSVINISSTSLSPDETSVLARGLTFCPTPRKIDWSQVNADIYDFNRRMRLAEYFFNEDKPNDNDTLSFDRGQRSNSDVLLQDAVKQFEKTEEKWQGSVFSHSYYTGDPGYLSAFGVTVNNLNHDMLLYIFSFLGMKDRVIIERVCRRWRTLAAKSWNSVRHLQFNHIFSLRNGGLTDDIFLGVLRRGTASLVSLDLSASASLLTDFAVHCIARHCRNLKFVDLTGVEVSTSSLKSLSQKCTLLEDLKNRLRKVRNCFFMLPASMESLNLRQCARITDVGLKYVGMRCQNLKIINISECFSLTDAGFLELTQNCSNIEALTFVQPPKTVTIHGLRSIENLKRLQELNISQCAAVSDEFLFALGQSCICLTPNISTVHMAFRLIHSVSILCSSLNIEACGPAITDAGLQSLAPCFQLKKLVISYLDEVTHDFINHLGQNINLQTFIVRACPGFTDEGVKCTLRFFKDLEHLDLSGCLNITDMCTEHIMTYYGSVTTTRPRLTIVLGGTQVTEECAHALQTRCHGCKILMDDLSNEMLRTDRDPYFGMRDFYPEFDEEDDDDDENEFEGDMANGDDHFYEDFLEAEDPALLNDYENWS
ncbi:predicted protein [Nematostella vectensis]|uniref:Uncharacterized protein n=1 Tax=Nematostella vectensis TaxID=45351 RepID=A7S4N6_NEMVE|nr:predicted protein [Nematostella vectensis]|eukprot:XP_001633417.1 predicted protein [Nematostella vectensis]